jgi:hypothetical protein
VQGVVLRRRTRQRTLLYSKVGSTTVEPTYIPSFWAFFGRLKLTVVSFCVPAAVERRPLCAQLLVARDTQSGALCKSTLHPTLHTLHPTLHALHPTPYTPRSYSLDATRKAVTMHISFASPHCVYIYTYIHISIYVCIY